MSGLLGKWIARVSSMNATINGGAYTSKRVYFPGGSYVEHTEWLDGVTRYMVQLKFGNHTLTLTKFDNHTANHVLTLAWEKA